VDGILLCDKPVGVTSHDVVAEVRRRLGRGVKVGHAGTLDPFATGLLIVLVGRATRTQRFFMALRKRYDVVARFGAVSSTGDPEGEIVVTGVLPEGELALPVGRVLQRPPAYSAVKVGGRRAYSLARAGEAVELAAREVCVYRFEETWRSDDRRCFLVECSSGTYVRSLIADLGDAYCLELRRTAIGPFSVADTDPSRILGLDEALGAFLPEVRLGPEAARRAGHGVAVARGAGAVDQVGSGGAGAVDPAGGRPAGAVDEGEAVGAGEGAGGVVRLTDTNGLIALAEPGRQPGTLKPIVGLRPVS
jgi:tRNA pseudouridine55 synthase